MPAFSLAGYELVVLSGRDAVTFAQSQFMNDVAALADGQWQWNGWLDPKGRVQALFALARRDADTLWLVTTADAGAMAAALRRFVFRSKVVIDTPAMRITGSLHAPQNARGAMGAVRADGAFELDVGGEGGPRCLVIGADADAAAAVSGARTWWTGHLAHGLPALPGVDLAAWTPQQLSLQRLNAFSVRKGCYPGQEIVARTHFLGRAKRGLARIDGEGLSAGMDVTDANGRSIGQIVCAIGEEALAVVPLDPAGDTILAGGRQRARRPLLDGLQR